MSGPRQPGRVAACRDCDAPIVWVVTEKGRKMPLDAAPDPIDGRFLKTHVDEKGDGHVRHVKNDEVDELLRAGRKLYASHFKTCPNADERRRSR